MIDEKLQAFRNEIQNGLRDIDENFSYIDDKLKKPEYAFLYWVLMRLYNIDEELVADSITEYNDKAIDCFVHYEENKELYIIQCKYYDIDHVIDRKDVADFLQTPLIALKNKKYKRSKTLQKIFSNAIEDPDYKIYFHFYSTSTFYSVDIDELIKKFNREAEEYVSFVHANFMDLAGIYELYYGKSFKERKQLTFKLGTVNRGTFASLREEYDIPDLRCEAYYIITPVSEIYKLYNTSKKDGYQLFEENIREYLGESSINRGIIDTLKGKERNNFLFYNNGITMICSRVGREEQRGKMRYLEIENPQVVNGCQTVNSIFTVLSDGQSEKEIQEKYQNVFVMVKVLVVSSQSDDDKAFYKDVVKYTNKQNAVPDKVFLAGEHLGFTRIQTEFGRKGFYLRVKQSDRNKFDNETKPKQANMMELAKAYANRVGFDIKSVRDISIDLDKLLQVLIAYIKDGYYAYTKKNAVLKETSDVFKSISVNIQDYLSIDNMILLYYTYCRAEREKKQSSVNRTPIPYYVIGLISYHINGEHTSENMNRQLDKLFSLDKDTFNKVYEYLKIISNKYCKRCQKNGIEYNVMIKQKIDVSLVNDAIDDHIDSSSDEIYSILSVK